MHRVARQDAGRLDVDAHLLVGLDRALAVDRISEAIDDAAEKTFTDRNFDDGASPLDRIAFLDRAVVAENNDADVVGFEVQRHATDAAREFDPLTGVDVIESVDAGDAITHRKHLADFGNFSLFTEVLDLILEDRG